MMGSPGVGAEGAVGGEAYWSALEARLLAVEGVSAHPAAAPALRAAVASIREEERREARGGDALRAWLGWAKERRRLARQGVEERPTGEVLAADQDWTLALLANGTLEAFGDDVPDYMPIYNSFVSVAAGVAHGAALTRDGAVMCWGTWSADSDSDSDSESDSGEDADFCSQGDGVEYVAVCACNNYTAALAADGEVRVLGPRKLPVRRPEGLPPLARIDAGGHFIVGLTAEGDVVLWSTDKSIRRKLWPRSGELSPFDVLTSASLDPWRTAVEVRAGFEHFAVLMRPLPGYEAYGMDVLTFGTTGVPRSIAGTYDVTMHSEPVQMRCGLSYVFCVVRAPAWRVWFDMWEAPGSGAGNKGNMPTLVQCLEIPTHIPIDGEVCAGDHHLVCVNGSECFVVADEASDLPTLTRCTLRAPLASRKGVEARSLARSL